MQHTTIENFLKKRAFLTPERPAVYFQDQIVTFEELNERSLDTAGKLQGLGVQKDDFVAVLLKNHLDTIIILFALQLLGAKTVILNNRLTPSELVWQLEDSRASLLILDDSFNEMKERAPFLTSVTKGELFGSEYVEPVVQEEIHLDDICTIMYTSGTTGHPKGVVQTYGNHWWSAIGSALNLGITENDCWLCTVPLFHISGFSILMRSVIYGMPLVLHNKFDAEKTIEDIKSKGITIMSIVGTMLSRVVDSLGAEDLPDHFRCMLLGGGPAPLPLLEACVQKNIPVYQTYGMTETSSQIVTLSPEYSLTKLGSAGKPLFPSEIRIERDDQTMAGAGEAGEIVVKGYNVTSGYLYRPEATSEKIREGWLYTGDIGYIDEDGFLYVLDRRSDLIISGGENIYPAEIEAVLLSHPEVADAGVTAMDDSEWGQVPVAFIVSRNKCSVVTEDDLLEFCQTRLAKYKVPKEFFFVDELPRNASKKLLRRTLRQWVQEEVE
jgi:o-succinylbenzoate---CoA ligase